MLRKASLRRITIATCALLIIGIIYFFPTKDVTNYQSTKKYNDTKISNIFLIDQNDYVAMTNIPTSANNVIDQAREIIAALTIGNKKSEYIPNNFKATIPKNTKLNDISFSDNTLKLDFSKELLDVKNGEQLIESLVYSLTSIDGVDNIIVFVQGNILQKAPNSTTTLPATLNRSIGINKTYDLNTLKDISKTTIYYISKDEDLYYYVPVTKISNSKDDKVQIIINELKSSPIYQTNLMSYLKANAEIEDYEIKENSISLSFNEYLFEDLDKKMISEEVKYTILLSLKDSLNIDEAVFLVNNEEIAKLTLKNVE